MQQFGGKPKKTSSESKRHFTVVMGNKEHGLYISSTPSSAAKKAVTKLCTANKSKKVEFYIREITQGSKKKTYGPYEGYIEKLKEPIELKGRVIKYKPIAKLSGKTSKKLQEKRGRMSGGGQTPNAPMSVNSFLPSFGILGSPEPSVPNLKNINNVIHKQLSTNPSKHTSLRPRFVIETKENIKSKRFELTTLVWDWNKSRSNNKNHYLFDLTKSIPGGSEDRKSISFLFRKDITEEKIQKFLHDEQKKSKIIKNFIDLGIAHEATIFLDIPYTFDGGEETYERYIYLKYTPPPSIASAASAASAASSSSSSSSSSITFDESRSISQLKNGLEALGLQKNEYKNGARKGLESRGFTGRKFDTAYTYLVGEYMKKYS